MNEKYKIAISETLYYLNGICQDDINKIPNSFMNFLKNNTSQNYKCKFDYTKPLNELNLKTETKGLIAMICLNYWCETEKQKNIFKEHLNNNEKIYLEKINKKYNINNLFDKKESILPTEYKNITTNQLPVKLRKENIFKILFNYIIKFFHKK